MDTVVDVVPAGETVIAVKAAPTAPVDLLGRQEIVDRIMKILEVISEKRSSCTFALNGAWGTGKTFVLNMLMNQLWEYHSDKYIVFHYNCWQYDYYEEPLIAIVAAMLDSVDEENHLLPENLRDKAKAGMELAKPVLKKIATDFVKNKIGVDLTDVVSSVKDYQEALNAEEQKKEESRSFDEFYSFKKAIQQAQNEIRKLTEDRTLVVVVDELDRCLPNYAIKVLERLHHLFANIDNTAIILAVDKSQLNQTIAQSFGKDTDTTKYLRKFVNLELQLHYGEIQSGIWDKYSDFFSLFDKTLLDADFPYEEYIIALLSELPMRTQECLMERLTTIHSFLLTDEKKDYSFMCFELTWAVFHERLGSCDVSDVIIDRTSGSKYATLITGNKIGAKLAVFIERMWSSKYFHFSPYSDKTRYIHMIGDKRGYIQMAILYYISEVSHKVSPKYSPESLTQVTSLIEFGKLLQQNVRQLEQFCHLFSLIM